MARPAADSVKVQWTGTSTGTMSLGAAVTGFQAFPAAFDGQLVSYAIENETGTERENGFGTYTASGTTLTRDFVTFSTAGAPTKQNFSAGTKHVRVTPLAHDVIENRAASDPGPGDDITDGYVSGRARWFNTSTGLLWFCVDHSTGAAIWTPVLHLVDSSALNPGAVNLAANRDFDPYTQTGAVAFALAAANEVPGAWSSVEFSGNGAAITWSADFEAVDGSALTGAPYSGFTGTRRLILMWSGTQAKALVSLSGPTPPAELEQQTLTSSTTITWDTRHPSLGGNGQLAFLTLANSAILSMSNLVAGTPLQLVIQQDGTGGRPFALDGATCGWLIGDQGIASAANAISIYDITVVGNKAYFTRRGAGLVG
jgi:hypothetical protein